MLYMVVYHTGPEGLALNPPLRFQHGATPGCKVVGAWTHTNPESGDLRDQRTWIVIDADTPPAAAAYVAYMRPFVPQIEMRAVNDYLPGIKAHEARDPELTAVNPAVTPEVRQQTIAQQRRYIAAKTPLEALEIWRNTAGPGGGKDALDARRIRRELDQV